MPSSIVERIRALVALLPDGGAVTLPADVLRNWLEDEPADSGRNQPPATLDVEPVSSWRQTLWTAPPQVRLGLEELCEATGWSRAYVYRRTSACAARGGKDRAPLPRIPHRRAGGRLVFEVGEIRRYLQDIEDTVVPGKSEPRGPRAA